MSFVQRAARLALGVPFVWLGYEAAKAPGNRVELAEALGVPSPELAVRFNGAAMVAGGAALCLDVAPRAAAIALVAALVPTTVAGHAFWKETDPKSRNANRIQVLKNLGLFGGLLAVAASRRPPA
jgi:putative oxidoreductase